MIAVRTFDVMMRQAADLGAATFLLRAYVAGEPDEFVQHRAESWVAQHTACASIVADGNPLDDEDDYADDDESEDEADELDDLRRIPGARMLFEEGWI